MFAPDKEVSVAEFYTMAVRALNAGQLVDSEGTWPTNYVNFAIENKLAEDVNQIYSVPATRMTAATIVANTLEANMWAKSAVKSNGEITWGETDNNILYNTLNIVEIPNVEITAIKVKDLKATFKADAKVEYSKTEVYDWTTAGSKDVAERANIATAKAGVKYTVWYDKSEKEVVGFFIPDETTSLTFEEIKAFATSGDIKFTIDGEEEKFKGASATLYINGDTTGVTVDTTLTAANYPLPLSGIAYYGTESTSDKIVRIYAESQNLWGVVKEATDKKIKFEEASKVSGTRGLSTITIDLDKDSSYNYAVTKNGKEISIEDIEDGDVVFGYNRNKDVKDYVLEVYEDSIEGKVTAKSGTKVTIDGKKYDLVGTVSVNAGDEGTFYLSKNGKIVMFKADKKSSDVAMISAMKLVNSEISGASGKLMIKYTTMDGVTSDWTEVSSDKSDYEKGTYADVDTAFAALYTAKIVVDDNGTTGDPSDDFNRPDYALNGSLVAYTIKGGKVVFKENTAATAAINKDTLFFGITAFKDANKDTITTAETSAKTWYLTSGVKVFEKESNNKSTYKEEITLKEVNEEDLDDLSGLTASYMADLDFTQRTAGILVLEKTNIIADKKWAIVLDIAAYDDGDNDTKEDKQVTVLYAGDKDETVYIAEAANLKYTDASNATQALKAGDMVELSVNGDVIKRITDGALVKGSKAAAVANVPGTKGKYIVKEYDNNTYTLGTYTAATASSAATGSELVDDRYQIADDVVVVKLDDTEYKVSSFADIKFLYVDGIDTTDPSTATVPADEAARINDNNLNGANELVSFIEYTDEDSNKEIVAIIIKK